MDRLMKSTYWPLFLGILTLTACATNEQYQQSDQSSSWPPSNSLQIPYESRQKQFEKGNLVPNASFENGGNTTGKHEGAFAHIGWKKVGRNVTWAERDPALDVISASKNNQCIKITRNKATELDDAEGIISDYIQVIPGNYDFTYHVRFENILSHKSRLGVKLYDALVIKVLFFDERKQPVDAASLNPLNGNLIDNSDKSYSFSHFWRIDHFPWGRVRGRTYNYPFSEGDIPARTRYVRLFFGLKGTGTMWLDDIYFGYSKWNFTAIERFKPLFGRKLTAAEKLIPTPKHFQERGEITYYEPGRPPSHLPVIVLPENPAPAERLAAKMLQESVSGGLEAIFPAKNIRGNQIRILENNFSFSDLSNAKLILSIGKTKVLQKMQPDLPLKSIRGKEQGYVIQSEQIGDRHIVFLIGETPTGTYYAATTAVQLFENDDFVFHNATIADYPDYLSRAYVFKNWHNDNELQNDLDAINRMRLYKFNKVYCGYNRKKKDWYRPDDLYRRGLAAAGRLFKESEVMNLAVMVNPYSHLPMEAPAESLDEQLRYTWTHSNPESLRMLMEVYKIGLEAGADTLMFLSDDFVPHSGTNRQNYGLYTAGDKNRFVNLQNAQAYIINSLKKWIDSDYPGTRLEFCPPWYSNEHIDRSNGKAEVYFSELVLQIPQDVAIVWTGPTIRSLSIDMADIHRFSSLIGRWPMLWDNTLYARNLETTNYGGYTTYYPDKVTMCNLFEPYDTDLPTDFHRLNDSRQRYTNHHASSEVYKLKYATVADYLWNTAAYDPERSLWKVLVRSYGTDSAEKLIRFSDAYYRLYGICRHMETEDHHKGIKKRGQNSLSDLNQYLADLSKALSNQQPLIEELKYFRNKQKRRFEKLLRDKKVKETSDES
jgi:hypothetical protein